MKSGKLQYSQKENLLLVGFVLFLFSGYCWSFSDTISLVRETARLEEHLGYLQQKERELPAIRKLIEKHQRTFVGVDTIPVRDELTRFISSYAEKNKCVVTEIPSGKDYQNGNIFVQSSLFTVTGRFQDLLVLLNEIELRFENLTRVVSARFYTATDYRNRKKQLYLSVNTHTYNHHKP